MNTPLAPLAAKFFPFVKIGMHFHASLWVAILLLVPAAAIARDGPVPDVISSGPVSIVTGNDEIHPEPGMQGNGGGFNSLFFMLPGEGEADRNCDNFPPPCGPDVRQYPNRPYDIAYESPTPQPVQSNDWWPGVGLQWYVPQTHAGWAFGWSSTNNKPRTHQFISEPFAYDFVDFPSATHGLRLWNQNAIAVKTDGKLTRCNPFDPKVNEIDRGFLAPENQAVVTVGLENVHPLSQMLGPHEPTGPPWTNVRVRRYSDWGLVLAYANSGSEMEITMANGSPFTWFERKLGSANFLVWVGGPAGNARAPHIWKNDSVGKLAVLGVTVETPFNADNNIGTIVSKAAYLVIADQGTWVPEPSPIPSPTPEQLKFRNATATKVVVLAMPHNVPLDNASLQQAATVLLPYACRKIVDSRIDYPPIPQSMPSVIVGNETVTLGYSPAQHRVALQLRLETAPFLPGNCAGMGPVQLLFPHHLKSLPLGQQALVDRRYEWHSLKGPLRLYMGSSFVQLIDTKGFLPFFPKQVVDSDLINPLQPSPTPTPTSTPTPSPTSTRPPCPIPTPPTCPTPPPPPPPRRSQLAVEDIYETMRNWFYLEEAQVLRPPTPTPTSPPNCTPIPTPRPTATPQLHINSFVRNIGTYDNQQFNTYEQGLSTLIESLMIADQLANSTKLTGIDTSTNNLNACLCKPKTEVAAEMRDYILQTLKELVGQWADVYTAQFMQYNPRFNTTYGFPAGYGSVQNLNDHHFHFGYFLRAAAAIGRYDRDWLNAYRPFFERLRKDVANYDRTDTSYPFLRNFSPFYGHNWADGTGQDGTNQESTSEAMNFSAALIELGLLLGNNEWRDIGMYMYEQEILAAEQYWFNQDADLRRAPVRGSPTPCGSPTPRGSPTPDPNCVRYNGNWPEKFVTFDGPPERGGGVWHSTLAGRVHQRYVDRATFFGGIDTTYFIQMIPMSASTLYLGRNQNWLNATWQQYLLDTDANRDPAFQSENETFIAAWQALMPTSGQGINGTGLDAALKRIARPHEFKFYGTNTMAKYWAYTNHLLGQVDTSVHADIPAYSVFNSGSGKTFVAYNASDQEITVHFTGENVSQSFPVPPRSIASSSGGGTTSTFAPSQLAIPTARLYLGATSPTPGPGASPSPLPLRGRLSHMPENWLPTNETYSFPENGDFSRIMRSLAIVPVATGNCADVDLPGGPFCRSSDKAYAEWEGTFKGNLVGSKPYTQMAIYVNPALHPGWQQDPSFNDRRVGATHVRIEYYFNAMNQIPDRVEVVWAPSYFGNTFVMQEHKITNYYFRCYNSLCGEADIGLCDGKGSGFYGLSLERPDPHQTFVVVRDARPGIPNQEFPCNVRCGKIKVQVYGPAGSEPSTKVPVHVSVGTSPLLNRASWVQPPYDGGECASQ